MPVGNIPGWDQVLAEDFNGNTPDSNVRPYQGVPGSSPTALWEPSHDLVANGMLDEQTYQDPAFGGRWVTGGAAIGPAQTYGKYEVRFRMDGADGVKYAILLWPTGTWPQAGEIDFGEGAGTDQAGSTLTVHYGASNSTLPQEFVAADVSQWHTIGVEWTAGKVVWTLDGQDVATLNSPDVPSGPMFLAIQSETSTDCSEWGCIDASTPSLVELDVDWVVEYQPAG